MVALVLFINVVLLPLVNVSITDNLPPLFDYSNQLENVVLNELNAETPNSVRSMEFIELRFTDQCLFKRAVEGTGYGPSLDNYYIFMIRFNNSAIYGQPCSIIVIVVKILFHFMYLIYCW